MKHISRKVWFTLSFIIVGASAIFACKKPLQKEKASHVVVDRLVNQLVCKAYGRADKSRFPRGVLGINLPAIEVSKRTWKRDSRRDNDYTAIRSSKKIVAKRVGLERGERNRRPIGGDF